MVIAQQLALVASKNLTRAAFSYLEKDVSYGDIRTRIGRLSYLYQRELGFSPRIAFIATPRPAVPITFFAITNIRGVSLFLDPESPPEEMESALKEAKITHIAVTSDLTSKVREFLQSARLNLPLVEIEKKQGGEYDTSYTPPPDQAPNDNDVILLVRSGGRKNARFATFNHKQIHHAAVCLRGKYHANPGDRILSTLSWAHPFSLLHGMLFPLLTGSTSVLPHGVEGLEFLDFLIAARVTRLAGIPPFFLKLLITCKNEKRTLPGIKSITVGLGPLAPEVYKTFGLLKIGVAQTYGQAEALWTLAMQDTENPENNSDSVGGALVGFKYKVLDASGDEIPGPDRRTGPLAVMGPTVMNAYLGKEREKDTKSALRGTWLYTGDIMTLEGEGEDLKMSFVGRKDEVAMLDGDYISLRRVDPLLRSIKGVQDAAAFVIKNTRGESVIACAAVKVPGSALTEQQLLGLCGEKLSSGLVPQFAVFTDFIPRDRAQNVTRGRLSAQFAGIAG